MRRPIALALTLAAAVAAAGSAHAWLAGKSSISLGPGIVLSANATASLSSSAVRYLPLDYSVSPYTTDVPQTIFTSTYTVTKFRFRVLTAPTSTATWTAELRKNGAGTGLSCTITSASSGKCAATGSVLFAAGDYANYLITPTNSPGVTNGSLSTVAVPAVDGDRMLSGRAASFSNSATWVGLPHSDQAPQVIASRPLAYLPDDGTIDNLYVISSAPGAAGETSKLYDWSITKSATAQATTCQIAADATTCNDTNAAHAFAVTGISGGAPGDYITFPAAPSGTPTSATATFALRYRPTTSGSFPLIAVFPLPNSTTNPMYYSLSGGTTGGGTEANNQSITDSMTITKLAVKLNFAPGAGKSRAYTLRVNGADTALTCTIADTAVSCSATGSIAISDDDLVATSDVPTGTPTASTPNINYLANR